MESLKPKIAGPTTFCFRLSKTRNSHYNLFMKFYGELLVFALLFITNLRVFFVHHVRRDPLVVLAPFTFVVAILQIFAWGIDIFTTLGLLIALFVLLSNFHAIFRYLERLYIDHYSPLMKVWAAFTIIISAIALAATVYFAPVEQHARKLGITENQYHYNGSFRSGFEPAKPFSSNSMTLYEFKKENNLYDNLIVLFVPDKRGDTEHYIPYLHQLAAKGLTVYSADFYAEDGQWLHSIADKKIMRRLIMVIQSTANNKKFTSQKEYYSYNISQEYSVLIPLLRERCGADKKFFLITDYMADIAAEDFEKKNPESVAGIFQLTNIEDYKTSGYGCIEQTDPLLALALGLKRDSSFSTPKLLAEKTMEVLNDIK